LQRTVNLRDIIGFVPEENLNIAYILYYRICLKSMQILRGKQLQKEAFG